MAVNLKEIGDAIFSHKEKWGNISEKEKNEAFFIFNRYFSKKYPEFASMLNNKKTDKNIGMDLWFHFMDKYEKKYPNWLWKKADSKKEEKKLISDEDFNILLDRLKIKKIDLLYLIEHNIDDIKKELKRFKKIDEQRTSKVISKK